MGGNYDRTGEAGGPQPEPMPATKMLYVAALATYGVSFFLPTFGIQVGDNPSSAESGFTAFLVSFLAIGQDMYGGPAQFLVWLANPAFWGAAVFFARGDRDMALAASCAAALLGCWLLFGELILVGFYVWKGSMVLLALASLLRMLRI